MTANRFATFDELWFKMGRLLLDHGDETTSRAGTTKEGIGVHMLLENPEEYAWLRNPARKLSRAYASAELMWYLGGDADAELVKAYAPQYEQFLDDKVHAYGAYGARWKDSQQLQNVYTLLREQPDTRQAVMNCWRSPDLTMAARRGSKDIPCTLTLQFIVRDELLHVICNMRSNDFWLGMPYDIWCFTRLQVAFAEMLDVDVGCYVHQVGSLHVYESHWEKLEDATDKALHDYEMDTSPEADRVGADCPETLQRMNLNAMSLERTMRTNGTVNWEAADNMVGTNTMHRKMLNDMWEQWK